MQYLKLEYSSHTEETSTPDPNDAWDRASTSTDHTVHGLRLFKTDQYQALPCPDKFKSGDKLFCLWAIYSTGDSFGHAEGSGLEFISYHKTRELAEKNEEAINEGASEITLDNGEKQTIYRSWDGYFESLDSLTVRKLEIE